MFSYYYSKYFITFIKNQWDIQVHQGQTHLIAVMMIRTGSIGIGVMKTGDRR